MIPRPRILVTNDDGVEAPGLALLAEALSELGEPVVFAPAGARSGASMAGHFHGVLCSRECTLADDRPATAVDGYPVDCVRLGLTRLRDDPPALVAVGINAGLNLASDLWYSGTVGAACDAALWGFPALAVSGGCLTTDGHWGRPVEADLRRAAAWGLRVARRMLEEPPPPGTYYNLNVPGLAQGPAVELRLTRPGCLTTVIGFRPQADGEHLWGYDEVPADQPPDADIRAIQEGCVSLSVFSAMRGSEHFQPAWRAASPAEIPLPDPSALDNRREST